MTSRRSLIAAAMAAAAMLSCAHRQAAQDLPDSEGVSVDVASLWKKEATTDPITAYKLRLASDPDNAALHNNLGNQYVLKNQLELALHEFRQAAKLDRGSPVPWNNLGTTYKKMGKLGDAMDAFQKSVEIDERYALGYYNIGTIYDERRDYDNAIESYLTAISLNPSLLEPTQNPQVLENRNLLVVKLRNWLEESGNIALPLDRLPE